MFTYTRKSHFVTEQFIWNHSTKTAKQSKNIHKTKILRRNEKCLFHFFLFRRKEKYRKLEYYIQGTTMYVWCFDKSNKWIDNFGVIFFYNKEKINQTNCENDQFQIHAEWPSPSDFVYISLRVTYIYMKWNWIEIFEVHASNIKFNSSTKIMNRNCEQREQLSGRALARMPKSFSEFIEMKTLQLECNQNDSCALFVLWCEMHCV